MRSKLLAAAAAAGGGVAAGLGETTPKRRCNPVQSTYTSSLWFGASGRLWRLVCPGRALRCGRRRRPRRRSAPPHPLLPHPAPPNQHVNLTKTPLLNPPFSPRFCFFKREEWLSSGLTTAPLGTPKSTHCAWVFCASRYNLTLEWPGDALRAPPPLGTSLSYISLGVVCV